MLRNMVIGKLKYLIGPASGTTYSRGGCPGSTDWKERGTIAWAGAKSIPMRVVLVPQARLKFDSESSASHGMRLLNVFGHTELQVEQMLIILLYD